MDIFLLIALPIAAIVLIAIAVISIKRKATIINDDEVNGSMAIVAVSENSLSIPIERITALSVIENAALAEIKDASVIARITQTLPAVADTAAKTVTNQALKSVDMYRVIIPSGETLVKSKDMQGAFRGFYRGAKSTKGHANLVKVDPTKISKASTLANIGANVMNVGSLVVGQYYMSEINSKLETMNQSINKIGDFQDREFKSRIISLIALVGEVSQFSTEIIENDELRTIKLTALENMKADTTELLGQVNETIVGISNSNPNLEYKAYQEKIEEFSILVEYQNILITVLEEISKLTYLLGKGGISSDMCYSLYKKYWKLSVQARSVLEIWHEKQVKTHKIDLDMNRRSKRGIEGFFAQIPAFIDDRWKYKELHQGIVEKISSQTQKEPKIMVEHKAVYEDDVQIIVKEGKYYYLPVVPENVDMVNKDE